jgi:hypothetical protein
MAKQERSLIPDDVLKAARAEYHASLFVHCPVLMPISCDGVVVGFYCPRERKIGHSLGTLFVLPEYRRRHLVLDLYRNTPGRLVECVRYDNYPMQELMPKAGFRKLRRYSAGWWWVRE